MATITFSKKNFEKIVGKKLNLSKLVKDLNKLERVNQLKKRKLFLMQKKLRRNQSRKKLKKLKLLKKNKSSLFFYF